VKQLAHDLIGIVAPWVPIESCEAGSEKEDLGHDHVVDAPFDSDARFGAQQLR